MIVFVLFPNLMEMLQVFGRCFISRCYAGCVGSLLITMSAATWYTALFPKHPRSLLAPACCYLMKVCGNPPGRSNNNPPSTWTGGSNDPLCLHYLKLGALEPSCSTPGLLPPQRILTCTCSDWRTPLATWCLLPSGFHAFLIISGS